MIQTNFTPPSVTVVKKIAVKSVRPKSEMITIFQLRTVQILRYNQISSQQIEIE